MTKTLVGGDWKVQVVTALMPKSRDELESGEGGSTWKGPGTQLSMGLKSIKYVLPLDSKSKGQPWKDEMLLRLQLLQPGDGLSS